MERICTECKDFIDPDDSGFDYHICGYCADKQYERHMERREFEYYHPGDE